MIKDRIENSENYYNLSKNIKAGLEWIKSQDFNKLNAGRYYIDGEKVFVNVDEYETKENANFEAHRKYIDIQFMIDGEEYIGVTNINNCTNCIEYDTERDIEFLFGDNEFQTLKTGEFLILYPHDAHKPCISINGKTHCKKAVVKVLID